MSGLTVAGIGSRYLADDGVGLYLVGELDRLPAGVRRELWEDADAPTLTLRLLELSGPVLLVDCADMGLAGGEWRCFRADPCGREGRLLPRSRTVSCHGLGVAEAVAMAVALGFDRPVHVFGVQPCTPGPEPLSARGLSPAMRARLPALVTGLRHAVRTLCHAPA